MTVAFCGHSHYLKNVEDGEKILAILEMQSKEHPLELWLGEYGAFDRFAYECAKKYKEKHPETKLIFITPYIDVKGIEILQKRFDSIVYPPIESVPPRYAISHRNRWIAEKADIIIAYITQNFGGAYEMYRYAKGKNKKIYNVAL